MRRANFLFSRENRFSRSERGGCTPQADWGQDARTVLARAPGLLSAQPAQPVPMVC